MSLKSRQAVVIVLLFCGYGAYYFCRADLSVATPLIIDELPVDLLMDLIYVLVPGCIQLCPVQACLMLLVLIGIQRTDIPRCPDTDGDRRQCYLAVANHACTQSLSAEKQSI